MERLKKDRENYPTKKIIQQTLHSKKKDKNLFLTSRRNIGSKDNLLKGLTNDNKHYETGDTNLYCETILNGDIILQYPVYWENRWWSNELKI